MWLRDIVPRVASPKGAKGKHPSRSISYPKGTPAGCEGGSGGTGETPSQYPPILANRRNRERRREAPPPQVPEGGSAA